MATTSKKTTTKAVDMVNVDSSSLLDALLPNPQTKPTTKKTTAKSSSTKKATTTKTTAKTAPKKTATSTKKPVKKEANNALTDTKKAEKKLKAMTKEEKAMYKKLWEHFNYVANLTMVIEERKMDTKLIPDLTIGEMHVLETVDRLNGKPMTKIANELKVTVGSLTIGVNRLVSKEYLLRIRDDKDHRIVNLSVTPKAKKVLKSVGLEQHINKLPNQLSGGQMQRVSIARAIVNDPDIILADEPTGALDTKTGRLVMDLFHKLNEEQHKTIVLITHSPELAEETEKAEEKEHS